MLGRARGRRAPPTRCRRSRLRSRDRRHGRPRPPAGRTVAALGAGAPRARRARSSRGRRARAPRRPTPWAGVPAPGRRRRGARRRRPTRSRALRDGAAGSMVIELAAELDDRARRRDDGRAVRARARVHLRARRAALGGLGERDRRPRPGVAPLGGGRRRRRARRPPGPPTTSTGDVVLPDGRRAWLDGGPIRHLDPIDGVAVLHAVQLEHRSARHARAERHRRRARTRPDSPRSRTPAARPASSPRPVRARPGCSPSAPGTCSSSGRCRPARSASWRSTSAPRRRCRRAPPTCAASRCARSTRSRSAIVNGAAPFAPQPRQWRTIDEPDVRRILQRFVQSPKKLNVDPLAPWIDALSLVRLGLVDPAEVEGRYGGDVDGLAEVWPLYRDALDRQGVVDFDDQVRRAIDVLLTQPAARRAAQRACRVLLVDEFQDLTPAHVLLVRLLTARGGAVFGVGDDDQTIYGYNGADPAWLIDFATWFPGAGDHPLEVNYRCPAGVVEVADRLLRHNRRRVAQDHPRRARPTPGGLDGRRRPTTRSRRPSVAVRGRARRRRCGVRHRRAHPRQRHPRPGAARARRSAGVPFVGGLGTDFVERTAVRAALAWLRLALGSAVRTRRPRRGAAPAVAGAAPADPRVGGRAAQRRRACCGSPTASRTRRTPPASPSSPATSAGCRPWPPAGPTPPALLRTLVDEIGLGGAVATLDGNRRGMNRTAQGDDLLALAPGRRAAPRRRRPSNAGCATRSPPGATRPAWCWPRSTG